MMHFNANLFRIAALCRSKEETRYYLQGVFVKPHHAVGVTLTATDGHRLIVIHDETGFADECAIVRLGADALKQCKPKRGERRIVRIETGSKDADVCCAEADGALQPFAKAFDIRVDGAFPDYRRVVPKAFGAAGAPHFAGAYISTFAAIAGELATHFLAWSSRDISIYRKDAMRILSDAEDPNGAPAIVLWPYTPQAFGVLMPIALKDATADTLPTWFAPPATAASKAA